jgi:hypothetical protein
VVKYAGLGDVGGGIASQPEARDYFARMSVGPSPTFKAAANEAIYEWKKQGTWSLILGLWLFCADTAQASLLSVIGDTPRDAVVIGTSPTFTALKGYSGFTDVKQIKWPITSTILANDGCACFAAGKADDGASNGGNVTFIESDAGTGHTVVGNFYTGIIAIPTIIPGVYSAGSQFIPDAAKTFVGGSKGGGALNTAGLTSIGGTATRSSNYRTSPIASGHPLQLLSAVGFLANAATDKNCRDFMTTLQLLLNRVGAFD